ncbi:hypothetical protein LINPERPRIM_LOCUS22269 [Linum perenne]
MQRIENQGVATFCPILSRLDRLDRMLKFLEDRYFLMENPAPCSVTPKTEAVDVEDECISLSSALELVKQKGNVVERLEFLENRILQLSLELKIGNNSQHMIVKPGHLAPHLVETEKWSRGVKNRKWVAGWKWFNMGCTTSK